MPQPSPTPNQGILLQIEYCLEQPLTGAIIGLISLVVSIVGLGFTIYTWCATKRIEKKIAEEKVLAIEHHEFNKNRDGYISILNRKIKAVKETNTLSSSSFDDVIEQITALERYNKLFSSNDNAKLEEYSTSIKQLRKNKKNVENVVTEYIEIVTRIINILEKGEYKL